MQKGIYLVLALQRGLWAVDADYAHEQQPLIEQLLARASLADAEADAEEKPVQYAVATPGAGGTFPMSRWSSLNDAPPHSAAVISVSGPILKYSFCGLGSLAVASMIREAAAHPNIDAIVVDMDSFGGQPDGLLTVATAMREARAAGVPVVGRINDAVANSAGYLLLAACSEIWAVHASDKIGGIGMYATLRDHSEADKKEGRRTITIYAPQSTKKNLSVREALAGKPELLTEELRRDAQVYLDLVSTERGDRLQPAALEGGTHTATEALDLGIIDGIAPADEILSRAFALARPTSGGPAPSPNSLLSTMKYPKIRTAAGIAAAFEKTADGVHLQEMHLDAIESQLEAGATAQEALTVATAARQTAETALATATTEHTAALAARDATIAAKDAEIARLGHVPGDKPATPVGNKADNVAGDDNKATEAQRLIDELPHNKAMDDNPLFRYLD